MGGAKKILTLVTLLFLYVPYSESSSLQLAPVAKLRFLRKGGIN